METLIVLVGGGTKGYPTADVTGIIIRSLSGGKIGLRWSDPEDSVLDNAVLSAWKSTIVVRKDGSVPENVKDGTLIVENLVKNQYQEMEYVDQNGLENGHTYYYRFFTKSTEDVIGDGSPTVKMIAKLIDPILANNDWNTIIEVAESGAASEIWNVGDEIDITLSGTYTATATFQIWDFAHYDKSDGSGKTGITFGMKNLLVSVICDVNGIDNTSTIFLNCLPEIIKNSIKEIIHKRNKFGIVETYNAKAHIPTGHEIGLKVSGKNIVDGDKFPIFTNNASRIKDYIDAENPGHWWWTETEYSVNSGVTTARYKLVVGDDGGMEAMSLGNTGGTIGFCAVFDI